MRILVVDDERTLSKLEGATYARTLLEAKAQWLLGPWDQVWLDHDLGPDEDIRPFVRLLAGSAVVGNRQTGCFTPPSQRPAIRVLTMNPVGAQFIIDSLKQHYEVQRVVVTDWL